MKTITITDLKENKVLSSMQTEDVLYWRAFIKTYFIIAFNRSVIDKEDRMYVIDERGEKILSVVVDEAKETYLFFNEYYERTSCSHASMTKSELKKFLNKNLDYVAENSKKEYFAVEDTRLLHSYENITIL